MDELQAGIESSLAVFPLAPVFLQPGDAAPDYPAFGNFREFVQLATLGNLHRRRLAQDFPYPLSKKPAHVTAVSQHAQATFAALQCLQRPFAVRLLGKLLIYFRIGKRRST